MLASARVINRWTVYYNFVVNTRRIPGGGYFDEGWNFELCQKNCIASKTCNGLAMSERACWFKTIPVRFQMEANKDPDTQWDLWVKPR